MQQILQSLNSLRKELVWGLLVLVESGLESWLDVGGLCLIIVRKLWKDVSKDTKDRMCPVNIVDTNRHCLILLIQAHQVSDRARRNSCLLVPVAVRFQVIVAQLSK